MTNSKTITIVTNGIITIEINLEATKAVTWAQAQEAGFPGGRTSFMNLLNSKVTSACGFEMQTQTVVEETPVLTDTKIALDKVKMLKSLDMEVHVVEATTETYGTVACRIGRIQLNPLSNGKFSVMVFPKKGYSTADAYDVVGTEFNRNMKSQYVALGKLTASEVEALNTKLA